MARDYAKSRNPNADRRGGSNGRGTRGGNGGASRGGSGASASAGLPGWVYLMMGLAIGLAVAAIVYIGRAPVKIGSTPAAAETTASARPAAAASAAASAAKDDDGTSDKGRKGIALPPKRPSRYAFYELLPSYEVAIPRESAKAAAAAPAAKQPASAAAADAAANQPPDVKQALAEPGQYLIQVGAYRSREEADKNRASLALIGVESRIEQVTIDQKDTWYRVRIGPEATLEKAQAVLERLDSNDIKGILVKVKS